MVCAPVIEQELREWVSLGGGNSGCCGNKAHDYGYHMRGNQITWRDYSRRYDPGMPYNMSWCCAGDFSHRYKPHLMAKQAELFERVLAGEFTTVDELIGKPWPNLPVLYFFRYNGMKLKKYTGAGHDHWSHIGVRRSRANIALGLWRPKYVPPTPTTTREVDMRVIYCKDVGKHALVGENTFNVLDTQTAANEEAEVWGNASFVSLAAWNREQKRVGTANESH